MGVANFVLTFQDHLIKGERVQVKAAWDRETAHKRVLDEKERKVFVVNLAPEIEQGR